MKPARPRTPGAAAKAAPTPDTYEALQRAYEAFNRQLFAGRLPPCLITLQRQRGAYGYFSRQRFHGAKGATTDEIALNPNHIQRGTKPSLATLAHEMVHLWQHHCGTPGRRGYHNAEWAAMMDQIGLTPSATGLAGGKRTGQKMTHLIASGGRFEAVADRLAEDGLALNWHDPHADDPKAKKARNTRSKYACPDCGLAAWAKPEITLLCGECDGQRPMQEEPPDDAATANPS